MAPARVDELLEGSSSKVKGTPYLVESDFSVGKISLERVRGGAVACRCWRWKAGNGPESPGRLVAVPSERSAVFTAGDCFVTLIEAAGCRPVAFLWVGNGVPGELRRDLASDPRSDAAVALANSLRGSLGGNSKHQLPNLIVVPQGQETVLLLASLFHHRSGLVVLQGSWSDPCGTKERVFELRDSVVCTEKGAVIAVEVEADDSIAALLPSKSYIVTCGSRALYYMHMESEGLSVLRLGERICQRTASILGLSKKRGAAPLIQRDPRHLHVRSSETPPEKFWASMGLRSAPPWPATRRIRPSRLFAVDPEGLVKEAGAGGCFCQSHLADDSCALLDGGGREIFLWVGKRSSPHCQHLAAKLTMAYARKSGGDLSIVGLEQGAEVYSFLDCFIGWNYRWGSHAHAMGGKGGGGDISNQWLRRPPSSGTVDVGVLAISPSGEGGKVKQSLEGLDVSHNQVKDETDTGAPLSSSPSPSPRRIIGRASWERETMEGGEIMEDQTAFVSAFEEGDSDFRGAWSPHSALPEVDFANLSPVIPGGGRRLFDGENSLEEEPPTSSLVMVEQDAERHQDGDNFRNSGTVGVDDDSECDEFDPFEMADRAFELEQALKSGKDTASSSGNRVGMERSGSVREAVERARSMIPGVGAEHPPRSRSFRVSMGVHAAMNQMQAGAQKIGEVPASEKKEVNGMLLPSGADESATPLKSAAGDEEHEEDARMVKHRQRRTTMINRRSVQGFTPPRLEQGLAAAQKRQSMMRRTILPPVLPEGGPDVFDAANVRKRRPSLVVQRDDLQIWAGWRPGPAYDYAIDQAVEALEMSEKGKEGEPLSIRVQNWCVEALEKNSDSHPPELRWGLYEMFLELKELDETK